MPWILGYQFRRIFLVWVFLKAGLRQEHGQVTSSGRWDGGCSRLKCRGGREGWRRVRRTGRKAHDACVTEQITAWALGLAAFHPGNSEEPHRLISGLPSRGQGAWGLDLVTPIHRLLFSGVLAPLTCQVTCVYEGASQRKPLGREHRKAFAVGSCWCTGNVDGRAGGLGGGWQVQVSAVPAPLFPETTILKFILATFPHITWFST